MYHCDLNIALFSRDRRLEELVRGLAPLERFSHRVLRREAPDPRLLAESQVILWDLPEGAAPCDLRRSCGERARLILCASRAELDGYGEEDLRAADECWERPLHYGLAQRRLQCLLERLKLEQDLYLATTYLDTAIDSIPDMMWFKALDGTHVKVNRAFCSVVGKDRSQVTGRDHCDIWGVSRNDPNSGEATCRQTEEAVIRTGRTLQFTENVKSPQGMRQLTTYKSPLYGPDGAVLGTVGFGHDVTDLGNLSAELEILLGSMPYAILLRDNADRIFNVNSRFEEYFQVRREAVLGKTYSAWIASAFEAGRTVNSEGFVEANVRMEGGGGKTLEIHEDTIYDIFQNPVGQLCIFRNVTMERQLEAKILHNSNTDFMTGLYNRRCLYQYANNNCHDRPVSLLYVDLDRFKAINDTYGHKVGDEALILTASLLLECFPADFVARIGGDEFLIIKIGTYETSALEREAQRLLDRLRSAFNATPHLSALSASIGIAKTDGQPFDMDLLIQQSDAALYQAKQSGRSRYCVYGAEKGP